MIESPEQSHGALVDDGPMTREVQRIISLPHFTVRHTACTRCEFQPHAHTSHVITTILKGRMSVTVGGESLTALEGQTAMTEAAVTHSGSGADVEFVSVSIDPVLLSELACEIGLLSASADITFRTSLAADEDMAAIARAVAAEMSRGEPGLREMLDALLRQLAIHLLRTHLTMRKPDRIELSRAGPVDRRLRRAIEFMHDNYSRELMLDEIASAAYLSEYHFARMFKQITGVTPHLYLANLRLERARKLLLETSHPISEIAAMVGYQSQSHFTKIFKSVTGVTPRAFRDAARAESASHR